MVLFLSNVLGPVWGTEETTTWEWQYSFIQHHRNERSDLTSNGQTDPQPTQLLLHNTSASQAYFKSIQNGTEDMTSLGQASTQDSQNGPLDQKSDNVPTQSIQNGMLDKNSEDQAPTHNNLNGTLDETAKGHVPTHFISTGILDKKSEDEAPTQNSLNGKMNQTSEGQEPTQNSLKFTSDQTTKGQEPTKNIQIGRLLRTSEAQTSIPNSPNSQNKQFVHDIWDKANGILRKFVLPSICIPGLLLNVLVIIFMLRSEMKSRSVSVYYVAIATGDMIYILASFVRFSDVETFGISVTTFHRAICAVVAFGMHFGSAVSTGSVILLALERIFVLRFPLRAKEFCSKKRSVIACMFMSVCAFGVHAFNLAISDVVYISNQKICWINPYFSSFNTSGRVWVNAVFDYFMPICLIVICNITLIRLLLTLKQKRQKLVGKKNNILQVRKNTVTAVMICTTFILLFTPICAYKATQKLVDLTRFKPATFIFMFSVCLSVVRASFTDSVVYILTCVDFRNELLKTLGILKQRMELNRSSESGSLHSEIT